MGTRWSGRVVPDQSCSAALAQDNAHEYWGSRLWRILDFHQCSFSRELLGGLGGLGLGAQKSIERRGERVVCGALAWSGSTECRPAIAHPWLGPESAHLVLIQSRCPALATHSIAVWRKKTLHARMKLNTEQKLICRGHSASMGIEQPMASPALRSITSVCANGHEAGPNSRAGGTTVGTCQTHPSRTQTQWLASSQGVAVRLRSTISNVESPEDGGRGGRALRMCTVNLTSVTRH